MKKFIMIALLLMLNTSDAQIFKCETSQGKVVYQDTGCNNSDKQKEVVVQQFDPEKIIEAQAKLNKELQQREHSHAAREKQALQERKILALEEQARSNEELAYATRENANAVKRNTAAVKHRNQRKSYYYYTSSLHRAIHHQKLEKRKPKHKQFKQTNEIKASISIN